ncbi:MAG: RNA-directed DNA polymerase, partial [bacterium]
MNQIITNHFTSFQSCPTPHPNPTPPWELPKAIDPFKIQTSLSSSTTPTLLHQAIQDPLTFQECKDHLPNGKAHSPTDIPNEILKHAPQELKECIHLLFQLMWAAAYTPPSWKESYTILLYKNKGETTDINKYRPIALLNTIYKLWTKLQQRILSDYAEEHNLLSSQQAGFRKGRNCIQQLQLLTSALEDARLTGQNIFALIIDFSSAFNMIDHTTLHTTLTNLNFPPDAGTVIKDLYSDAHSRIRWDITTTSPIPIKRGTMQGDTLSPFLFLCYMEPLLRWLHVGGRGYQFGCLPTKDPRLLNHISSAAYADDLIILTHTPSDLKLQAEKLTNFCNWAHMPVNTDKTYAT